MNSVSNLKLVQLFVAAYQINLSTVLNFCMHAMIYLDNWISKLLLPKFGVKFSKFGKLNWKCQNCPPVDPKLTNPWVRVTHMVAFLLKLWILLPLMMLVTVQYMTLDDNIYISIKTFPIIFQEMEKLFTLLSLF